MSTNIKPNKITSRWRERNAEVCLLGSHEQRDEVSKVCKKRKKEELAGESRMSKMTRDGV